MKGKLSSDQLKAIFNGEDKNYTVVHESDWVVNNSGDLEVGHFIIKDKFDMFWRVDSVRFGESPDWYYGYYHDLTEVHKATTTIESWEEVMDYGE